MTSLADKMEERPAPTVLTYEQMRPGQEVEQHLRTHGHLPEDGCCDAKAEAAVVGDWEQNYDLFASSIGLDGDQIDDIRTFTRTLLVAKDREKIEAYAQGWNEGQIDLSARLKI